MRFTTLAAAGLIMSAAAAPSFAADLPRAASTITNWTGVHIGINGGYGWGDVLTSKGSITGGGVTALLPDTSAKMSGGFAGAQVGYDLQMGNFVVGVETDFQGSAINHTDTASALGATVTEKYTLDAFGTTRARAGVAFDQVLVYGTAGVMYAAASAKLTVQPPAGQELVAINSSWHLGYTVGAGAEWAFARDWTARVEYLYADLGSASYALDTQSIPNITAGLDAKMQLNLVRFGINARF
jgi:outer membrane immunogenic protein